MLIQFLTFFLFYEGIEKLFMLEIGITFYQIGVVAAWIAGTQFLLEIPTGIMADRFGRKKTLIFANISLLVGSIILWRSNSLLVFIAGSTCIGAFLALQSGTLITYALDGARVEHGLDKSNIERRSINGMVQAAYLSGASLSAVFSGFIAQEIGLRDTYVVSLVGVVIATFLIWRLPEYQHKKNLESSRNISKDSVKLILNNHILFQSLIVLIILVTVGKTTAEYAQIYFSELQFGVESIGMLFAMSAFAGGLGFFIAGSNLPWVEKLSEHSLIILSVLLIIVGLFAIKPIVIIFSLVIGFRMLAGAWLEAIQQGEIAHSMRSTTLSVMNAISKGVLMVTITIVGIISEISSVFIVFGGLGIIILTYGLVFRYGLVANKKSP